MLTTSPSSNNQSSFFDIFDSLDLNDALIALSNALPWPDLEKGLAVYYSEEGRPAKPIRLMSGLLMLKQLFNLSDENVVSQWKMNPYFQFFCGETSFQSCLPCHPTDLVKFRQRIGESGVKQIFAMSVKLHGEAAEDDTVFVDTTVQEKAITYPTDTKLAIKIINRVNKLAKGFGVKQRRTFVKEVKQLRIDSRFFGHVKKRKKAKKALKRLRTIADILMRELERKLPEGAVAQLANDFAMYRKVLAQQSKDKNKIYSLHEPQVYCVAKGKAHKKYEYGSKASIVSTRDHVIVGVAAHDTFTHDSETLQTALDEAESVRETSIKTAVVDKGYQGSKSKVKQEVILPGKPLKRDNDKQRARKRTLCKKRSSIEPVIGHLKQDFRLCRNFLKGFIGDQLNLLMAACAWNLKKWINAFFVLVFIWLPDQKAASRLTGFKFMLSIILGLKKYKAFVRADYLGSPSVF